MAIMSVSMTTLWAQETLSVDIGPTAQNVQSDFVDWSFGVTGNSDLKGVTTPFTNFGGFTASLSCAGGGDCGVAVRVRSPLATGPVGNLIQDAVKNPVARGLRLTFSGLRAGSYQMTTYHHDPTAVHGTMDILMTDARGAQQLVADEILISTGTSDIDPANVAKATFFLQSDGTTDMLLDLIAGDNLNNAEVWLNGFVLAVYEATALVTITQQPANVTAQLGGTATFTVVATVSNAPPASLTYQWRRNNSVISGATEASYTTPVLEPGDLGTSTYTVLVGAPGASSVFSQPAVLTVANPGVQQSGMTLGGSGLTFDSIDFGDDRGAIPLSRLTPTHAIPTTDGGPGIIPELGIDDPESVGAAGHRRIFAGAGATQTMR